jgi:hypothetical protein
MIVVVGISVVAAAIVNIISLFVHLRSAFEEASGYKKVK